MPTSLAEWRLVVTVVQIRGSRASVGRHHASTALEMTKHRAPQPARFAARLAPLVALCAIASLAPRAGAQQPGRPPAKPDSARHDTASMHDMPGMKEMPGMRDAVSEGADERAEVSPMGMIGPLGISHVRMGSGTSWMPDSSLMHANHKMWGRWTAMLHGVAFGMYDDQGSKRGDRQPGIVDWEMLMAMRRVGAGMLHLHAMASLEPATLGDRGYPLLLQSGEAYRGAPLHDRQHPHDFVMELATLFQQPLSRDLAVELYAGVAGEPALGPVAFMHRPSAQNDPLAPLGHHWQDATHIAYGVVTAGAYSHRWKLEGSVFNGREPDENRWDVDLRTLDSYSGRLTVNPTGRVSLSAWYGWLPSPESLYPTESAHRIGASAQYAARGVAGGAWGSTVLWSANDHDGALSHSVLAESNLEVGAQNALFARVEYVQKSAQDLVAPALAPGRLLDTRSVVAGYMREIASFRGGTLGVGARGSVDFIPAALEPYYRTRTPAGFAVYLRVRPKRMAARNADAMGGMKM